MHCATAMRGVRYINGCFSRASQRDLPRGLRGRNLHSDHVRAPGPLSRGRRSDARAATGSLGHSERIGGYFLVFLFVFFLLSLVDLFGCFVEWFCCVFENECRFHKLYTTSLSWLYVLSSGFPQVLESWKSLGILSRKVCGNPVNRTQGAISTVLFLEFCVFMCIGFSYNVIQGGIVMVSWT